MRTTIESAFQVPVFNRYGSREVGVIGAECDAHAGLHVNELDMVVEATPGPDGHGELLVTNLNNFGMPLIRYRIGDVGQIDTAPCRCGRAGARITRLFGRSSDFFTNAEGRKIHGEYFTHLFYGLDGIARFQLVQETLSEFQLKIVRNPDHWQDSTERFLRDELRKVFGDSMQLQIDHVDGIPATASGKFRFTISKV
jgi:phenylacetate-CoA ligase